MYKYGNIRCNVCEGTTKELEVKEQMLGLNELFVYHQCTVCGHTHLNQIPEGMDIYYGQDYYTHREPKRSIIKSAAMKAFLKLDGVTKSTHILDYGCGAGDFLMELRIAGYVNAAGFDPYNASHNLLKHIKWDVITLNHVFEHLPEPIAMLRYLCDLLLPSGKLILRFPVIDSYAFEKYRGNWVQFDAPRHINLFTRKSIALVIDKSPFKIIDLYDDSYHFQFSGSELYLKNKSLNHNSRIKRLLSLKTYWYHFIAKKLNNQNKGDQVVVILNKKCINQVT